MRDRDPKQNVEDGEDEEEEIERWAANSLTSNTKSELRTSSHPAGAREDFLQEWFSHVVVSPHALEAQSPRCEKVPEVAEERAGCDR